MLKSENKCGIIDKNLFEVTKMIDEEMLKEICELSDKYEYRWGKSVDHVGMPITIDQHRLVLALRIMVDTGDSILVAYQKVRDLVNPYYEYLDSITDISDGEYVEKDCPLCGNKVRFYSIDNSYEFKCDTFNCLRLTVRGI